MKKSNINILLVVIIIILSILLALFATNTLSLNFEKNNNNDSNYNDLSDKNITDKDNSFVDEESSSSNDMKITSRDEIVSKLKQSLTNQEWLKENLYSKENCFNEKVEIDNQILTFEVLSDNENNPVVIVLNNSTDDFIEIAYKVYYEDGNILVKNITNNVEHPEHVLFYVDKNQGLVISTFGSQGYYTFKAYDVKNKEINVYDEYECSTGFCEYEYKGDKTYTNSDISIELNNENINSFLK